MCDSDYTWRSYRGLHLLPSFMHEDVAKVHFFKLCRGEDTTFPHSESWVPTYHAHLSHSHGETTTTLMNMGSHKRGIPISSTGKRKGRWDKGKQKKGARCEQRVAVGTTIRSSWWWWRRRTRRRWRFMSWYTIITSEIHWWRRIDKIEGRTNKHIPFSYTICYRDAWMHLKIEGKKESIS